MRVVYFTHSLLSCWNHGNAHFLRGVLRELVHRGHRVTSCEPEAAWSRQNLVRDHGAAALDGFTRFYLELVPALRFYNPDESGELERLLDRADLVIVHEWNEPELIAAVGLQRIRGGRFLLFFHDTHHRAVSDPASIEQLDLSGYDGVLAFGEALAQVYQGLGWGDRVFVWHEAADTRLFSPPAEEQERTGVVWIGNWGDEERSAELRDYLLHPAVALALPLDIYGVRYPDAALAEIAGAGAATGAGFPTPKCPRSLRAMSSRPMCPGGSMPLICRASPRSVSLRHWLAASRCFLRLGLTSSTCSTPAGIS
jgi:spore maturation protein CgeB